MQTLEKENFELQSACEPKHGVSQTELPLLEKEMPLVNEYENVEFDRSLTDSLNKLNTRKMELAVKLRDVLPLKRQLDDVPAPSELIQYERRFSELYIQIQEKHRQTRKYYDTYNALSEIKEMMLKEISLLNSIDSQFQDAMTSATGRSKLVDSMEIIVKGAQQKLGKVQNSLVAEQKVCDYYKEKHATTIAEQRHFSSLLKAFQEECTRNEKLRKLTST